MFYSKNDGSRIGLCPSFDYFIGAVVKDITKYYVGFKLNTLLMVSIVLLDSFMQSLPKVKFDIFNILSMQYFILKCA